MDQEEQALNTAPEATSETPTEEIEVPQEETEEVAEETSTEETEPTPEVRTEESKKSAQHRIREQSAEIKSLKEKLAESIEPIGNGQQSNYVPQFQPGQEITQEQYALDVDTRAAAVVEQRIQQERTLNRINSEAGEAVSMYPQLNPKDDSFDQDLSDAIYGAVESQSKLLLGYRNGQPVYGVNPNVNIKDTISKMMKPYQKSITREVGKESEAIAKQQSQSALRPTTIKQERTASEKSIEELEKELGVIQP